MSDVRALIFDVDGVIVTGHRDTGGNWAVDMEKDLGLDPEQLQAHFFAPHWSDIVAGRAGIEEKLPPVLEEIAPHLDTEDLLAYWFARDARLEAGLLAEVERLRTHHGFALHLATNQEHRRADHLWRGLGLEHYFDRLYYSADIGHAKPADAFFAEVENRCGFAGPELFFFDDQEKNVAAARTRGWQAHVWQGPETLHAALGAEGFF